jgi:hypothetical protein
VDSRQRFVIVYAASSFAAFTALTFLNTDDFGLYVSCFAILYFALRLILNPKLRFKIDYLGLVLLGLFLFYLVDKLISII